MNIFFCPHHRLVMNRVSQIQIGESLDYNCQYKCSECSYSEFCIEKIYFDFFRPSTMLIKKYLEPWDKEKAKELDKRIISYIDNTSYEL